MPKSQNHRQLLLPPLLIWIDHKSHNTNGEDENMMNTRGEEMRIQHLYRIEEHSLCMTTVMLGLLLMDFDHLVEAGVEVGLALVVRMHLLGMMLCCILRT
jgi:hypothetical protein